jgi:hypothetical protein
LSVVYAGAWGKVRLRRLEEAFIFDRSIDQRTYIEQRDSMRERLAIAEMEFNDARLDELDVEGVLAFSEHLLSNLASLWAASQIEDRRRLQDAIFPTGLTWQSRDLEPP